MLDQSKRKPNKIWVDKGSELCNRSIKFWLKDNGKKCIQHIMKEYFLLKDLLRLEKMTFTNTWIQYQKSVYMYLDKLNETVNK